MKRMSFASAKYVDKRNQARRKQFLIEAGHVVSGNALIAFIKTHYTKGEKGRPAYSISVDGDARNAEGAGHVSPGLTCVLLSCALYAPLTQILNVLRNRSPLSLLPSPPLWIARKPSCGYRNKDFSFNTMSYVANAKRVFASVLHFQSKKSDDSMT